MTNPSTAPRRPNLRKKLLIDPEFQLRLMSQVVVMVLATGCVFFSAKALFFHSLEGHLRAFGLSPGHMIFRMLDEQSSLMNWILLGACAVESLILAVIMLRLSHRVAGPLYRLRTHLTEIADGKKAPSEVRFRKGDYFQNLAGAYNRQLGASASASTERRDPKRPE